MNIFVRNVVASLLGALMMAGGASVSHAQTLPNSTLNNSNPTNSPIHRANPNSRQGTKSSVPPVRGPSTAPNLRAPTLENGGIGNGYPTRQQPARPSSSDTIRDRKTTD
ncbi:hypothetical protein [Pseudomonas sp. DWP3-1-2]|uniref:hypothetical protein n=1 Tax=Pseudomonas sp. DWP3-1-2 TaxID=2804645 RepID=UPI003CEE445B